MSESRGDGNRIAGRVLDAACSVISRCDAGKITLDDAADALEEDCRRIVEHLLFTFYRHRKPVEKLLDRLISRPPRPEVAVLLRATATQLLFQRGIAAHSAVNVAVEKAKKWRADKFVNGVLRNLLRTEFKTSSSAAEILPDEILCRWQKRFSPEELDNMAGLFVREPEFSYRILPGFEPVENSRPLSAAGTFRFAAAPAEKVLASETLKSGGYYIQDPATSWAVALAAADATKAHRVLDLCAAPGGKTLMLGELCPPECRITAADISARRQERSKENFILRSRPYEVITATAADISGKYDIILADLPCSNTGVFRKRPDALWNFSGKKLQEIIRIQRNIARDALKLLAPGGILIVSTCSIEVEENEALIEYLCSTEPQLCCEEKHLVLPASDHDGAFAARLRLVQ